VQPLLGCCPPLTVTDTAGRAAGVASGACVTAARRAAFPNAEGLPFLDGSVDGSHGERG